MTTQAQKDHEERQVREFLNGVTEYTAIEPGERPDFWVRCSHAPDFALEVTEYHPEADGLPGVRRSAVEARWWKELEPLIERERQARPALQEVMVRLGFNRPELPRKNEQAALATELVRLVETIAPHASADAIKVKFVSHTSIATAGPWCGDTVVKAKEDWPETSKHLSLIQVFRLSGGVWLRWQCRDVAAGWSSPSQEELRRILKGKAEKARGYNLGGAPLWLLIVSEVPGDVQSHIFPQTDLDLTQLVDALRVTGFDFQAGPFSHYFPEAL